MYVCKECGKPVERTIEGELICESCWNRHEDPESAALNGQIHHALTHCCDCDNPLKTAREKENMRCNKCQNELESDPTFKAISSNVHEASLEEVVQNIKTVVFRMANGPVIDLGDTDKPF